MRKESPTGRFRLGMAMALGVEAEDIIIEAEATDTKDHPIYVKKIVGSDEFILVTSATHMPRAMALFKKHDMHPTPAPTDYLVMKKEGISPGDFFPSAGSLGKAGQAPVRPSGPTPVEHPEGPGSTGQAG